MVSGIAHFGDDTFDAGLAGVLVNLASIDLEALAELEIRIGHELFENRLALAQRQFPKVVAVEVKQVERSWWNGP